jgi:hypothetical protein
MSNVTGSFRLELTSRSNEDQNFSRHPGSVFSISKYSSLLSSDSRIASIISESWTLSAGRELIRTVDSYITGGCMVFVALGRFNVFVVIGHGNCGDFVVVAGVGCVVVTFASGGCGVLSTVGSGSCDDFGSMVILMSGSWTPASSSIFIANTSSFWLASLRIS